MEKSKARFDMKLSTRHSDDPVPEYYGNLHVEETRKLKERIRTLDKRKIISLSIRILKVTFEGSPRTTFRYLI